jgi:hypothetical protein
MPHVATARARRAGSAYSCLISDIDDGISTAADPPCTNRATTSAVRLGASPQAAEATANTTRPPANARRAPTRSASAPADSSSVANISVYPSSTHCRPVIPPPRSCRIDGTAMLATRASSVIMKKPSTAAARVQAGRASARRSSRRVATQLCVHNAKDAAGGGEVS